MAHCHLVDRSVLATPARRNARRALLAAPNQDTDEKDADAADDHLERSAQKRRVHVTIPNRADYEQLDCDY